MNNKETVNQTEDIKQRARSEADKMIEKNSGKVPNIKDVKKLIVDRLELAEDKEDLRSIMFYSAMLCGRLLDTTLTKELEEEALGYIHQSNC